MRRALPAVAVSGLALLVLVLGVLADVLIAVAIAGLVLPAATARLHTVLASAAPSLRQVLRRDADVVLAIGELVVLVAVVRSDLLGSAAETVVVAGVIAAAMLRPTWAVLTAADARLRRPRASLRHLPGPGGSLPAPSPALGLLGTFFVTGASALMPLALLVAATTGVTMLLVPAALSAALVLLAVVAAALASVVALARRPRGAALVRAVHEAVLAHGPTLVLYSNGGAHDLHWITPWLPVLEDLQGRGRPALIMLRKSEAVDLVPATTVPLVCLPEGGDVLPFTLPDARVALFVANGAENVRLLRNPVLRSAFIGHGDSDKASSANPTVTMYDEVWVAGEAGRRRYLEAGVRLRPEQVRVVGRPQLSRVDPASTRPPGAPFSVLYAPTWEGVGDDPHESSLALSGRQVVRALLDAEVRVVFRPHPATGRGRPAHAGARRGVGALLAAAGPQHATVGAGGRDLYACFNDADALVADVSGVVSDFLAADKPYLVVNGAGSDELEFHKRNPSTAGAYLVGPGASGLTAALADLRSGDSMAERRRAVRRDLVGPPAQDPVGVFADALDALAATAAPPGQDVRVAS